MRKDVDAAIMSMITNTAMDADVNIMSMITNTAMDADAVITISTAETRL